MGNMIARWMDRFCSQTSLEMTSQQLRSSRRKTACCLFGAVVLSTGSLLLPRMTISQAAETTATAVSLSSLPAAPALPEQRPVAAAIDTIPLERITVAPADATWEGRDAIRAELALLKAGEERMLRVSTYTATFVKQESIAGALTDEQEIQLKLRHAPLSIYMKWNSGDTGREALFVDGLHENKMVVHVGGLKGRFMPSLHLDPAGSLALSEARYPIMKVGVLELARVLHAHHVTDLSEQADITTRLRANGEFDGRPCYVAEHEYRRPAAHTEYHRMVTLIDREWLVPVSVRNYGWPKHANATSDDDTLLESYSFRDLQLTEQLADVHFDRLNEDYRLRR